MFAVVPSTGRRSKRGSAGVIDLNPQGPFVEAIRLLRANLLHTMAGRKQQAVMVTSAMPGDGKSTVAANLALTLTRAERVQRVLLVDADLHHPALHGIFGLPQSPGLSDYLNGQAELEAIIHTVELDDGQALDVICAGPIPPTPGDLVETQAMQGLIEEARSRFTFTVLDTPPYPLVATASVLASQVDRILSVCRVGQTNRALLRRHVDDLHALSKNVGLVVNVPRKNAGGYGAYGKSYLRRDGNGRMGAKGSGRPRIHVRKSLSNAIVGPTARTPGESEPAAQASHSNSADQDG